MKDSLFFIQLGPDNDGQRGAGRNRRNRRSGCAAGRATAPLFLLLLFGQTPNQGWPCLALGLWYFLLQAAPAPAGGRRATCYVLVLEARSQKAEEGALGLRLRFRRPATHRRMAFFLLLIS